MPSLLDYMGSAVDPQAALANMSIEDYLRMQDQRANAGVRPGNPDALTMRMDPRAAAMADPALQARLNQIVSDGQQRRAMMSAPPQQSAAPQQNMDWSNPQVAALMNPQPAPPIVRAMQEAAGPQMPDNPNRAYPTLGPEASARLAMFTRVGEGPDMTQMPVPNPDTGQSERPQRPYTPRDVERQREADVESLRSKQRAMPPRTASLSPEAGGPPILNQAVRDEAASAMHARNQRLGTEEPPLVTALRQAMSGGGQGGEVNPMALFMLGGPQALQAWAHVQGIKQQGINEQNKLGTLMEPKETAQARRKSGEGVDWASTKPEERNAEYNRIVGEEVAKANGRVGIELRKKLIAMLSTIGPQSEWGTLLPPANDTHDQKWYARNKGGAAPAGTPPLATGGATFNLLNPMTW